MSISTTLFTAPAYNVSLNRNCLRVDKRRRRRGELGTITVGRKTTNITAFTYAYGPACERVESTTARVLITIGLAVSRARTLSLLAAGALSPGQNVVMNARQIEGGYK